MALPFWPCGPQWFLWQLLALNVLAAGLHRFAPDVERRPWAAGGHGARASGPFLCRAGRGVGAGLCAARADLFAVGLDELRAVLVPAQPAAALSRLFLRRLCGRRLWPRPRAARQRWRAGAALGRVARRFGRGLRALGAADVADGRRPRRRRSSCRPPRRSVSCWPARRAASLSWRSAFVLPPERARILDSLSANAYSMYLAALCLHRLAAISRC